MTIRQCAMSWALVALMAALPSAAGAQITIGYPGPSRGAYDLTASLRLQVTPKDADVFVDGYYAGKVDEFDGTFQRLRVEPGEHEIQLLLRGYRLYSEKLYLQPGHTFKVRHTMERLAPGEPQPERPVAAAPPPGAPRSRPAGPRPAPPPVTDAGPRDRHGAVAIRVQPADALILIDGQPWEGERDDRLTVQLDAGPHVIEVRKSGFRGYLTEVNIEAGKTLPLNIALAPE